MARRDDGNLFHAVHDDGDEEDLDELEARKVCPRRASRTQVSCAGVLLP